MWPQLSIIHRNSGIEIEFCLCSLVKPAISKWLRECHLTISYISFIYFSHPRTSQKYYLFSFFLSHELLQLHELCVCGFRIIVWRKAFPALYILLCLVDGNSLAEAYWCVLLLVHPHQCACSFFSFRFFFSHEKIQQKFWHKFFCYFQWPSHGFLNLSGKLFFWFRCEAYTTLYGAATEISQKNMLTWRLCLNCLEEKKLLQRSFRWKL